MSDKRYSERFQCYIRGDIVLNDEEKLACEVRDISDTGARLLIGELGTVPDTFRLQVPRRRIDSRVRVMRRGKDDLGVRFLD